jgi:hypothetical protein
MWERLAVIDVQVRAGQLRARLTGRDSFAVCWRSSWAWDVPLANIVRVYVRPAKPALGYRSRVQWGPKAVELRRVLAGRPSLWVDIRAEPHQRLALSVDDPEHLAAQIAGTEVPIRVRHGEPGPLNPDDARRLASGEFVRGD